MSEEIKVGEFVRTQYGYIRKVKSITKFSDGDIHIYCGVPLYYRPREITKHSNNIIDLIEVRRLCEWSRNKRNRLTTTKMF